MAIGPIFWQGAFITWPAMHHTVSKPFTEINLRLKRAGLTLRGVATQHAKRIIGLNNGLSPTVKYPISAPNP